MLLVIIIYMKKLLSSDWQCSSSVTPVQYISKILEETILKSVLSLGYVNNPVFQQRFMEEEDLVTSPKSIYVGGYPQLSPPQVTIHG